MRSVAALTVALAVLNACRPTPVGATPYDNRPKVVLNRDQPHGQNACGQGLVTDCRHAGTLGTLNVEFFVYVLAAGGQLDGVSQLECGITYGHGIDFLTWTSCGTSELRTVSPAWPRTGSGNLVTWDACQVGEVAVAGYFYCSAATQDTLRVTRHPGTLATRVVDCQSVAASLTTADLGSMIFRQIGIEVGPVGCSPCDGPCPEPPMPPPPIPPRLLLHVGSATTTNACAAVPAGCEQAVLSAGLSQPDVGPWYFAYLLATPGSERVSGDATTLAGIQCGITYDGNNPGGMADGNRIDIFGWTRCGTLEFPSPQPAWPAPGSANIVTWDAAHCQNGALAVAGYFYLGAYNADVLRLIPRPADGLAAVARCNSAELPVAETALGQAAFSLGGVADGCNPCLQACTTPTAVTPTTWSQIKRLGR